MTSAELADWMARDRYQAAQRAAQKPAAAPAMRGL